MARRLRPAPPRNLLEVASDLAAGGGVPDVHRIAQVEVLRQFSQLVGVVIHVAVRGNLCGASVATPVVGHHPVAVMRVPVVGRQSNVTSLLPLANASINAGSQLSRLPRKCCRRTRTGVPVPVSRQA